VTGGADEGDNLRVEIDAQSSLAARGLASALSPALAAAGLPTTIEVHHYGDHEVPEYRSRDAELLAAASLPIVYGLHVYLPAKLTDLAATKLASEIAARIRKWRRETGNDNLEVPIYGPDGETVIRTIEVDPTDHA